MIKKPIETGTSQQPAPEQPRFVTEAMQKVVASRIAIAEQLRKHIAEVAGQPMHFSLFVWDDEAGGAMDFAYVSTPSREDTARRLAAVVERWQTHKPKQDG